MPVLRGNDPAEKENPGRQESVSQSLYHPYKFMFLPAKGKRIDA